MICRIIGTGNSRAATLHYWFGSGEGLEKLSAEDRQILLWRAQDFTNADIGGWLGMKTGTVGVRYFRAKKRLGISDDGPETLGVSIENDITESGVAHE